jgi:biotin carboxylase
MSSIKQYLLIINLAPRNLLDAVAELRKRQEFANLTALILTATPEKYDNDYIDGLEMRIVPCSFDSDEEIAAAIAPYREDICGVICRADKNIQDLRRVIPFLPPHLLVSTPESLAAATNKRLMRTSFMQHYPEITPHFVEVHGATDATINEIEEHLQYPVIVKPANLASSLLIQSCHNQGQLKRALHKTFERVQAIYHTEGRRDKPQIIVEEYLEGKLYSIDAYVMNPGEVYYCPPVGYIPAKQLGIDDFFLYKRFIPAGLNAPEIVAANEVAAKAIAAVGLVHTSVHVELIHTAHGWKMIELGPRLGNFRDTMYKRSYDINHPLNDVLIRFGHKPQIRSALLEHCATYSIYPKKEGVLRYINGLEQLERAPEVRHFRVRAEPGAQCRFAKHGGHALAEFIISSKDKLAFDRLTKFIEEEVVAVVD